MKDSHFKKMTFKYNYLYFNFSRMLMSPSHPPHVSRATLDCNFSITLLLFHQCNISFVKFLINKTCRLQDDLRPKSVKCELGISCFLLIIIWPVPVSCLSPAFHPAEDQV